MKKLMMFAAAMTIVGGAHAWTYCGSTSESGDCEIPVWDLKASGKVANWSSKGYKAVNKMAINGAIIGNILAQEEEVEPGVTNINCCLESFDVVVYDKSIKTLVLFEDQEVEVLTLFGKDLDTVIKPGKTKTLESDVLWLLEGTDCDDGVIALQFVGFGKGKRGITKGKDNTDPCGDNSVEGCEEYYEWPSWTGWFTGYYGYVPCNLVSPICDFDCELVDAVAGGTWSAKYNSKLSAFDNASDVEDALLAKFKAYSIEALDDLCGDIEP